MLGSIQGHILGGYHATDTMLSEVLREAPVLVVSEPDGIDIEIDILNLKNVPVEILEGTDTIGQYSQIGIYTKDEFPITIQKNWQNPKFKARWRVGDVISKDSAYVYVLSENPDFVYILHEGEYITVSDERLILNKKLL